MKISVLLTTFNRRHVLATTFPGLLEQDFPPEEYELVVVVDGSNDGSATFLRSLPARCAVRIIEQENHGQVAAQNVALHAARGEIVLWMDDEVICSRELLREHVAAHSQNPRCAVFGPVRLAAESPVSIASLWCERWFNNYVETGGKLAVRPDFEDLAPMSPNTSVARSELLACGGFDEHFGHAQDLELALRLRQRGIQPFFQPTAVTCQISVKNDRELVRDAVYQARDYVRLARKHPAYRPELPLAPVVRSGAVKRLIARTAACLPGVADKFLRVPYGIADRLRVMPTARRAGVRLLDYRRLAAMLSSAALEAGSWSALMTLFDQRLPVLAYHHVGPYRAGANPDLTVSPEAFQRQIAWLARHRFTAITSLQWLECRERGVPLPDRAVLLTFDDAYLDLHYHALPVLRRYGFAATVFVVTGCIGGASSWDEPAGWMALDCMSAEQIRHWDEQGIEFGAHSHYHPDLTRLSDSEIVEELDACTHELERILGVKPRSFAYPYGKFNDAVRCRVRERFGLGFSVLGGLNTLDTNAHALRRNLVLPGDTWLDLAGRALWGKSPIRGIRWRARYALGMVSRRLSPHSARPVPSA